MFICLQIKLLENDKKDDNLKDKLYEVLCNATDALPHNIDLWKEKLRHLISVNKNDLFITEFDKVNFFSYFFIFIKYNIAKNMKIII